MKAKTEAKPLLDVTTQKRLRGRLDEVRPVKIRDHGLHIAFGGRPGDVNHVKQ
jgi:hypothetical protein